MSGPRFNRLCYAAAHVVMRDEYRGVAHTVEEPGAPGAIEPYIDWTATMDVRTRLDRLGFAVAEAMDTAQRFAIGWTNAQRLIRECGQLDLANGFVAGAAADHLSDPDREDEIVEGVVYQANSIRDAGGEVILLPLPWLVEQKYGGDDYVRVYGRIIDQLEGPLYIHWLGKMFAPNLSGYFPGDSFFRVMAHEPEKVRGAKLSLLDADFERLARERLADHAQILLTGDDFHFADLILGDDPQPTGETVIGTRTVPTGAFSHALLGVLDGIAEPAARALELLAQGEIEAYRRILGPCEALSRAIFEPPTQHYKAGLAFLSWLGGHQMNPMLVNHEECARSLEHYRSVAALAVDAGVLEPDAFTPERERELLSYLAE